MKRIRVYWVGCLLLLLSIAFGLVACAPDKPGGRYFDPWEAWKVHWRLISMLMVPAPAVFVVVTFALFLKPSLLPAGFFESQARRRFSWIAFFAWSIGIVMSWLAPTLTSTPYSSFWGFELFWIGIFMVLMDRLVFWLLEGRTGVA